MNRVQVREILTNAGVYFTEDWFMSNNFCGTRFTFNKRELKKVDKTVLKDRIKANFKEWCIEAY